MEKSSILNEQKQLGQTSAIDAALKTPDQTITSKRNNVAVCADVENWLSKLIDQVDHNHGTSEKKLVSHKRSAMRNARPTPRRSPESLIIQGLAPRDANIVVRKVVKDKEYLSQLRTPRSYAGKKFQRSRERSERPVKIALQVELEVANLRRAKTGIKKTRPLFSRLGKRKRRQSYLQNLLPSWNATEGVTLDNYLLVCLEKLQM